MLIQKGAVEAYVSVKVMKTKLQLIIILLFIFSIVGVYVTYVTLPMGYGDSNHYLKMAQSPGTSVASPWGYRIAIPYVAALFSSIFNFPIKLSFVAAQIGMYALFLTLLSLWLLWGLRISRFATAMSCLLFVFSYPGVYNLHNVVHVGFGEHLFVLLGCIANRMPTSAGIELGPMVDFQGKVA